MVELIKKPVYIQKIDGIWYGYMPLKTTRLTINGKNDEFLGDFVTRVQKDLENIHIKPQFKCINNYGLELELEKTQKVIKDFKIKLSFLEKE